MSNLVRELAISIFNDFGIVKNQFGKGLTDPLLQVSKTLTLEYEGGEKINHPIWAGEISLPKSKLSAMMTDLCFDVSELAEFALVIQMSEGPIHGLCIASDRCLFKLYHEKWHESSLMDKLGVAMGAQQLKSLGLLFNPLTDKEVFSSLFTTLSQLAVEE